jgi:hypothetical protein
MEKKTPILSQESWRVSGSITSSLTTLLGRNKKCHPQPLDHQVSLVADFINQTMGCWNDELIRNLYVDEDCEKILAPHSQKKKKKKNQTLIYLTKSFGHTPKMESTIQKGIPTTSPIS